MAARDVVTLNETASRLEVAQAGDTYNLPRNTNVAGNVTATGATVNGDLSVTGSQTLGGVTRNTWPASGSAAVGIDDVLINGHITARRQTVGGIDFAAISALLPAIAIVAHDDDEGNEGGWIDRQSGSAWKAALGSFPTKRLVYAAASQATIYDMNGTPTSWGVGPTGVGVITSVNLLNHMLVIGSSTGVWVYDFNGSFWKNYNATGSVTYSRSSFTALGTAGVNDATQAIVNSTVNDVAITYRDSAPVVNGVRVPTLMAFTAGGVSFILDDGNVWDITGSNTSYTASRTGGFLPHGGFWLAQGNGTTTDWIHVFDALPVADNVITINAKTGSSVNPNIWFDSRTQPNVDLHMLPSGGTGIGSSVMTSNALVAVADNGTNPGISVAVFNFSTSTDSMVAYITNLFNTGLIMENSIQTCIVGGATAATDRSVKALAIPAFTAGTFTANTSRFWFKDTANIVVILGATVANGQLDWWELVAGVPHHYIANVDGAGATLTTGYVDGVAGTPSTNVTVSGGTTLTILANVDVDTVRASVTAKTAEQVARTFTDEHPTFTGSACLLTGSSNVTELTYHERQDVYGAVNGTKKDYIKGLSIVDSVTTATGVTDSGNALPVIDLVKSGTSNTYVAPAIDVNAELNDAHAAIADAKQGTVTQAITSDASSVLTCPQGFKPIRVTSAAGTYISLSTNAPVFDGFLWNITTGVAAATVYDVEMRRV